MDQLVTFDKNSYLWFYIDLLDLEKIPIGQVNVKRKTYAYGDDYSWKIISKDNYFYKILITIECGITGSISGPKIIIWDSVIRDFKIDGGSKLSMFDNDISDIDIWIYFFTKYQQPGLSREKTIKNIIKDTTVKYIDCPKINLNDPNIIEDFDYYSKYKANYIETKEYHWTLGQWYRTRVQIHSSGSYLNVEYRIIKKVDKWFITQLIFSDILAPLLHYAKMETKWNSDTIVVISYTTFNFLFYYFDQLIDSLFLTLRYKQYGGKIIHYNKIQTEIKLIETLDTVTKRVMYPDLLKIIAEYL